MSDWNPELYLRFQKERNQPIIDLISRIGVQAPERIIDIGCGPGNSTEPLKKRWPKAEIIGIDNSEAMIDKARANCPGNKFIVGDACTDLSSLGRFDIVFANASLQWMPDHERLVPRLFDMVRCNGSLAVQIPQYDQMPISTVIEKVVTSKKWNEVLKDVNPGFIFHPDERYYDWLCKKSSDICMWATEYQHVMNDHDKIIEMMRATGLKTYLDHLPDGSVPEFIGDVVEMLRIVYPSRCDNNVLFPFKRLFFIANKK